MPNHCENDLTITGDNRQLRAFLDHGCDFNTAIPYPEKYRLADEASSKWEEEHPNDWKNRPKDGFNQGGYEWCIANWGTKWNAYSGGDKPMKVTEKMIKYSFSTAWSPPTPVVVAWSEKYPGLKFTLRYYERGCAFQGKLIAERGETIEDESKPYKGNRGG